jgi:hypothetical protein
MSKLRSFTAFVTVRLLSGSGRRTKRRRWLLAAFAALLLSPRAVRNPDFSAGRVARGTPRTRDRRSPAPLRVVVLVFVLVTLGAAVIAGREVVGAQQTARSEALDAAGFDVPAPPMTTADSVPPSEAPTSATLPLEASNPEVAASTEHRPAVATTPTTAPAAPPPTTSTVPVTTAPPAPAAPPAPKPTLWAFDACDAPDLAAMTAWKVASPYRAIGVYIGGAARACPNAALNDSHWLTGVFAQGWKVLPIYVGPQAPCTDFHVRMSQDNSGTDGLAAADDAANHAILAGLGPPSPIYVDIEDYQGDGPCQDAVRAFLAGWITRLHQRGFQAGLYGNYDAAILADAVSVSNGQPGVDAIWVAQWTGQPTLNGITGIPDTMWSNHQRSHQYEGDHVETWGGVSLEIDSSIVDGLVAP